MKPKNVPRPSSANLTRSLGSRSTSCEKEEGSDQMAKLIPALYDTKARNFKTSLGRKKALHRQADESDAARIETVVEEDEAETEKQTSHSQTSFKHRLHIVEDKEDDFIRVGRRSVSG